MMCEEKWRPVLLDDQGEIVSKPYLVITIGLSIEHSLSLSHPDPFPSSSKGKSGRDLLICIS
jgi:hypothetical protein